MNSSLFKILKNIPALSEIDEDDLKDVSKKAVLMGYPKDCVVYNIGDASYYFYVIKSGMVEKLKKVHKGHLFQIAKFYPDNFFGEMALINNIPRECITRCTENSEIYLLNINDFKEFLYL
jgi:CRP-like cAMP-binding protein